jgi:hypothetical protein
MSYMNSKGYVNRKHGPGVAKAKERKVCSWWIVQSKGRDNTLCGTISIGQIHFPKRLVGKRVRIKIEEVRNNGERDRSDEDEKEERVGKTG